MRTPESSGAPMTFSIMVFLLLALGLAGFGVLAAYITLCDRL
jgi:hypothetical protein